QHDWYRDVVCELQFLQQLQSIEARHLVVKKQDVEVAVAVLLRYCLDHFLAAADQVKLYMRGVSGEVAADEISICRIVFGTHNSQRQRSSCRARAIVIKSTLQSQRKTFEIVLSLDNIVVSAGLERGNRRLF